MTKINADYMLSNSAKFPELAERIDNFIETIDLSFVAPEMHEEYIMIKMQDSGKFDELFA